MFFKRNGDFPVAENRRYEKNIRCEMLPLYNTIAAISLGNLVMGEHVTAVDETAVVRIVVRICAEQCNA